MKCADCSEEILQKNPDKCPYCGSTNLVSLKDVIPSITAEIEQLKKAGKYEEAALKYEEIEMWDKAEECRKLNMGKVRLVTMECPHCGENQALLSKNNLITCESCGKVYGVPKKVLQLL
jgi:DNA-directed RNA polymerase subunit RPC12/RpoP